MPRFFNIDGGYINTTPVKADHRVVNEIGTVEPVSLDEAKNYIRVTNAQDDALIMDQIVLARKRAEKFINSDIISKQHEVTYNYLREPINFYFAPISSVDSVTIDGVSQVENEGYELLGSENPQFQVLNGTAENLVITYTTSGLDFSLVKQGILSLISEMYHGRTNKMETNWKAYLSPFKIYGYYGVR